VDPLFYSNEDPGRRLPPRTAYVVLALWPIDPDRAADGIGIGVQTRPPEALAHHRRRQTAAAFEIGMEEASEEGLST